MDSVAKSKTDYRTQVSQVSFKPGKAVDFTALGKAVDSAGFSAQEIEVTAAGRVIENQGALALQVAGTNQVFPLTGEKAQALAGAKGKDSMVRVTAKVDLSHTSPAFEVREVKGGAR
ncbi:MAG: hypothetical protein HYV08_02630 [Deltaproteobacteria bacterium]|nr:hypothetical protein [Deltaproteobacteria bacterium]